MRYSHKKPRITPGQPYVVIVAKRLRKYGREILIEGTQAGGDTVLLPASGGHEKAPEQSGAGDGWYFALLLPI